MAVWQSTASTTLNESFISDIFFVEKDDLSEAKLKSYNHLV